MVVANDVWFDFLLVEGDIVIICWKYQGDHVSFFLTSTTIAIRLSPNKHWRSQFEDKGQRNSLKTNNSARN